jgi:uncharacterized protein YciI
MPDYIYLTHPLRDGFFEAPTVEENAILEEHFQYLKKAVEAGTLVLAGPCLDDTFGVVIFHSENDQSAQAFMFDDPAVKQNVMMAELHPMRISLQSK